MIDNYLQLLNDEYIAVAKKSLNKSALISIAIEIDEIDDNILLHHFSQKNIPLFFWKKPSENCSVIALNKLINIQEKGFNRIDKTQLKINEIEKTFISNWNELDIPNFPIVFGGLKFSPSEKESVWNDYSDSDWFIPKFLFIKHNNKFFLAVNSIQTINNIENELTEFKNLLAGIELYNSTTVTNNRLKIVSIKNNDDKNKSVWIDKVQNAINQINSGEVNKIVLSREIIIELEDKPVISELIRELSKKYPLCYIFAFKQNDSIFFGASPERLAKIDNGTIEADALAGSISRGDTEEKDKALAHELLSSEKNLSEQNAVVDFIVESFEKFSSEIEYAEQPIIRKLPNIQHLWTPIKAKLDENNSIFTILKDIHPTPAICGVPWSKALSSITDMENHSRGLFAGIIGWFNFNCEGEFAVAIRSALLKENLAYAYAGCGIVEGSDPIAEYEETELKLKPILTLFDS